MDPHSLALSLSPSARAVTAALERTFAHTAQSAGRSLAAFASDMRHIGDDAAHLTSLRAQPRPIAFSLDLCELIDFAGIMSFSANRDPGSIVSRRIRADVQFSRFATQSLLNHSSPYEITILPGTAFELIKYFERSIARINQDSATPVRLAGHDEDATSFRATLLTSSDSAKLRTYVQNAQRVHHLSSLAQAVSRILNSPRFRTVTPPACSDPEFLKTYNDMGGKFETALNAVRPMRRSHGRGAGNNNAIDSANLAYVYAFNTTTADAWLCHLTRTPSLHHSLVKLDTRMTSGQFSAPYLCSPKVACLLSILEQRARTSGGLHELAGRYWRYWNGYSHEIDQLTRAAMPVHERWNENERFRELLRIFSQNVVHLRTDVQFVEVTRVASRMCSLFYRDVLDSQLRELFEGSDSERAPNFDEEISHQQLLTSRDAAPRLAALDQALDLLPKLRSLAAGFSPISSLAPRTPSTEVVHLSESESMATVTRQGRCTRIVTRPAHASIGIDDTAGVEIATRHRRRYMRAFVSAPVLDTVIERAFVNVRTIAPAEWLTVTCITDERTPHVVAFCRTDVNNMCYRSILQRALPSVHHHLEGISFAFDEHLLVSFEFPSPERPGDRFGRISFYSELSAPDPQELARLVFQEYACAFESLWSRMPRNEPPQVDGN